METAFKPFVLVTFIWAQIKVTRPPGRIPGSSAAPATNTQQKQSEAAINNSSIE
jgi:hypothetical protein